MASSINTNNNKVKRPSVGIITPPDHTYKLDVLGSKPKYKDLLNQNEIHPKSAPKTKTKKNILLKFIGAATVVFLAYKFKLFSKIKTLFKK